MSTSFWLEEEHDDLPTVTLAGTPDVEIVGAGVTGCSCALALAEAGLRVRVHEAREVAGGASGRNGGFALRGGAMSYDQAQDQLGSAARAYWMLSERALDRISDLAGDALRRVGSLRLAADEVERDEIRRAHEALVADGFEAEWIDDLAAPLAGKFFGALFHPRDGALQPARWVRRLARCAAEAGAEIREHSRVESLAQLEAEHLVVATDGSGGTFVDRIRPTRGQVVVTEPLGDMLFDKPHYSRHGFDYWQQTADRRLVLGGRRDLALETEYTGDEETTDAIQAGLEQFASELLGFTPRITHRWAGIWGTTADLLPVVGPVDDRVWVAAGYSGHGNVLGFACGELVARALCGDYDPLLVALDPRRAGVAQPSA